MFRPLLAGVLAAGVVFAAGFPGTTAQEKKDDKKDPPKKKERIAIAEPKDAAKDPDFAIQGEYEGDREGGRKGRETRRSSGGERAWRVRQSSSSQVGCPVPDGTARHPRLQRL